MPRTYLYPANNPRVKRKNYQATGAARTTGAGVRIQRFESGKPFVDNAYRNGATFEFPNGMTKTVYGNQRDLDDLQARIEKDPDKALKSLEFMGNPKSRHYYLNQKAPEVSHPKPSKDDLRAARMFPNNDQMPETAQQLREREVAEHMIETDTPPATILTGGE